MSEQILPWLGSTGIYTNIYHKTMGCKAIKLPLLLERVGVRRIKSSVYIPPLIPAFSLWRRCAITCVDTYGWAERA
jgi:hypothetical protein